LIRFIIVLLICAGASIGLVELVSHSFNIVKPTFLYQTVIFLTFATGVIYGYLYRVNKPDIFVQLYLFMMAVKLMGYGGYAFFMITSDRAGATPNVVFFMMLYFILTILEILFLYRKINQQQ